MALPPRAQLEAAAAKVEQFSLFGKPILEFDDIELKAFLWLLGFARRIDRYSAQVDQIVTDLENVVRAIEADGLIITITRTTTPEGLTNIDYAIDLPPPPSMRARSRVGTLRVEGQQATVNVI